MSTPRDRAAYLSQRGRSGRVCCRRRQGERGGRSRLESARWVRLLPERTESLSENKQREKARREQVLQHRARQNRALRKVGRFRRERVGQEGSAGEGTMK